MIANKFLSHLDHVVPTAFKRAFAAASVALPACVGFAQAEPMPKPFASAEISVGTIKIDNMIPVDLGRSTALLVLEGHSAEPITPSQKVVLQEGVMGDIHSGLLQYNTDGFNSMTFASVWKNAQGGQSLTVAAEVNHIDVNHGGESNQAIVQLSSYEPPLGSINTHATFVVRAGESRITVPVDYFLQTNCAASSLTLGWCYSSASISIDGYFGGGVASHFVSSPNRNDIGSYNKPGKMEMVITFNTTRDTLLFLNNINVVAAANINSLATVGNPNITIPQIPPIPEPDTYILMGLGLGTLGLLANRRKKLSMELTPNNTP
jgi:hypothetical protein